MSLLDNYPCTVRQWLQSQVPRTPGLFYCLHQETQHALVFRRRAYLTRHLRVRIGRHRQAGLRSRHDNIAPPGAFSFGEH
jgi:hypothetical protein